MQSFFHEPASFCTHRFTGTKKLKILCHIPCTGTTLLRYDKIGPTVLGPGNLIVAM